MNSTISAVRANVKVCTHQGSVTSTSLFIMVLEVFSKVFTSGKCHEKNALCRWEIYHGKCSVHMTL